MKTQIIYQDETRIVEIENDVWVQITSSGKKLPRFLPECNYETNLSNEFKKALKANGHDPDKFAKVKGPLNILAPIAVFEAIKKYLWDRKEENKQIENLPENKEYRQIMYLFYKAEKKINEPGEYFPMLIDAKSAMTAWREKYPEAARMIDKQELIDQAESQESLARRAFTYDADGWLSQEDQEKSAVHFRQKAQEMRKKAEQI